jgi:hypothetical protein
MSARAARPVLFTSASAAFRNRSKQPIVALIYGDTLKHIVVAGSRWWDVRWCVSVCVSTRGGNRFPSVLLHPPPLASPFSVSDGEMSRRLVPP